MEFERVCGRWYKRSMPFGSDLWHLFHTVFCYLKMFSNLQEFQLTERRPSLGRHTFTCKPRPRPEYLTSLLINRALPLTWLIHWALTPVINPYLHFIGQQSWRQLVTFMNVSSQPVIMPGNYDPFIIWFGSYIAVILQNSLVRSETTGC